MMSGEQKSSWASTASDSDWRNARASLVARISVAAAAAVAAT
jgi:hypothetical protein